MIYEADIRSFTPLVEIICEVSLRANRMGFHSNESHLIIIPILKKATEVCMSKHESERWLFMNCFLLHLENPIVADYFFADECLRENHLLGQFDLGNRYAEEALFRCYSLFRKINSFASIFLTSNILKKIFTRFKDPWMNSLHRWENCLDLMKEMTIEILKNEKFPQNKAFVLLDSGVMEVIKNSFKLTSSSRETGMTIYKALADLTTIDRDFAVKFEIECQNYNITIN
jgi:hypothetical protein